MIDLKKLYQEFDDCDCGIKHECSVKDIEVYSGARFDVGKILKKNNFPKKLLLVADKTTYNVSLDAINSLSDFEVEELIYGDLRVARMEDVDRIVELVKKGNEAIISIGTGSLNDSCRLASFYTNVPFAIFATAPSMDGFASSSAPIVKNNFKFSYSAKAPDVIIADTKILAESPVELKSAGFGDMVAKYIALIDWGVSNLVSGETKCLKLYNLTRMAVDNCMAIADRVTKEDEESARLIFEGLIYTGIAMSFAKTSRPGSGTEHIMAHFIECMELLENKIPNYHGEDVGVMTLIMLKFYNSLLKIDKIHAHKEINNWDEIYKIYGPMKDDIIKLNTPDTITDNINPKVLEDNWDEIKNIIKSVPSYEYIYNKMKIAGCKTTIQEIDKNKEFLDIAFKYHPYMRRRLSLRRLSNMFLDEKDLRWEI